MTSLMCRFCRSSTEKLTNSIDDDLVIKLLEYLPKITLSEDPSLPVVICRVCFGKAKESLNFIKTICESQDAFSSQPKANQESISGTKSARAISNVKVQSAYEILKKIKESGAVRIKKVSKPWEEVVETAHVIKTENIEPVVFLEEVESDDKDADSGEVSSSGESAGKNGESDSDFEYEPERKRRAVVPKVRDALEKSKLIAREALEKSKSKDQKSNKDFYIDAPISFTCAKCKSSFDDFCTLSRHMKDRSCSSIVEDVYECETCGKQFEKKKSLASHIRSHQPKETVMCEGCGTSFNNQYELDLHSEATHRRVVKENCIYRCAHCPETFSSHLDLLKHVKEHAKGGKFEARVCEICAKEFSNSKSYRNHMVSHREVLPFICTVCKKGFTRNYLLTQHMHMHNGVKSFKCQVCSKSYAKKESLRLHKKNHHEDDSD